jgi:putative SOS response-associated peptidase YedK
MCGRFTFSQPKEAIYAMLANSSHDAKNTPSPQIPAIEACYNIAPTQNIPTVVQNAETNTHEFQQLRWGLIPSWAKDISMGAKLINARAETVTEKPAFRSAFKHRRCLVLADGFYEWQLQDGKKQPFYFRLQDGQPFAFAGLWEEWKSKEGEKITSCTILTTAANELLQAIHERMPVILNPQNYDLWLNQHVQNPEALQKLFHPYPAQEMTAYPVSILVNNLKCDRPECIVPLGTRD